MYLLPHYNSMYKSVRNVLVKYFKNVDYPVFLKQILYAFSYINV